MRARTNSGSTSANERLESTHATRRRISISAARLGRTFFRRRSRRG
jgi:hypothetical protein